jgi:hypothetical protein
MEQSDGRVAGASMNAEYGPSRRSPLLLALGKSEPTE